MFTSLCLWCPILVNSWITPVLLAQRLYFWKTAISHLHSSVNQQHLLLTVVHVSAFAQQPDWNMWQTAVCSGLVWKVNSLVCSGFLVTQWISQTGFTHDLAKPGLPSLVLHWVDGDSRVERVQKHWSDCPKLREMFQASKANWTKP